MYADDNGAVQKAVIILADCVSRKCANRLYGAVKSLQVFYEDIAEDNVIPGQQKPRMDPALKLFRDCPVMLTHNADVEAGKCNGTSGTLEQVVLKPSETPILVQVKPGIFVKAYYASQVSCLRVRHNNTDFQEPVFEVKPLHDYCRVKWPMVRNTDDLTVKEKGFETIQMKFNQFPVVRNSATTGHKLQGASVDSVCVFEWHKRNRNWAYVALSRVRTMDGLFIRQPIDPELSKYDVPEEYVAWRRKHESKESSYPEITQYEAVVQLEQGQRMNL